MMISLSRRFVNLQESGFLQEKRLWYDTGMEERRKSYKIVNILFTILMANMGLVFIRPEEGAPWQAHVSVLYAILLATVIIVWLILKIRSSAGSTVRLKMLNVGAEELLAFLLALPVTAVTAAVLFPRTGCSLLHPFHLTGPFILYAVIAVLILAAVFWDGIIRVYLTSVQLGIRHRVWGILLGWVFPLNLLMLTKIRRVVRDEVRTEESLIARDAARAADKICATRYPLLFVHGVFFRDIQGLNYWGRIPKELITNGAVIYYGNQQSADSVMDCGKELAAKIRGVLAETGAEKVNIIAHSKGGLDSRAAITHCGMAPYVASLTTINTPHRGCMFAEYLLERIPETVRDQIADKYNKAALVLGDKEPDFLAAVNDLTASACAAFNEKTPDAEGVLYESVMSYAKKASGSRFPLNMTHELVKHFDGKNDGLVAVEAARWGSAFTLLEPPEGRGISHGDMIDLNRENIDGFDVREFYVGLVASLKERGY